MKNQPIITIGRQYGSGGRYVAKLLAEKLDIPYYDKELLTEASKDSGICKELLESYDEKQGKNLLFSLISGSQVRAEPGSLYMDMPLNHKIFLAQFDTIRRIADEGPCSSRRAPSSGLNASLNTTVRILSGRRKSSKRRTSSALPIIIIMQRARGGTSATMTFAWIQVRWASRAAWT